MTLATDLQIQQERFLSRVPQDTQIIRTDTTWLMLYSSMGHFARLAVEFKGGKEL